MKKKFRVRDIAGGVSEQIVILQDLVIAGWAGRDRAAVDTHIREMEEIGVPAPSSVPVFYRTTVNNIVQTDQIQVLGNDTSGEAETVLIQNRGEILVALGSDHTDRRLESFSIAASKQICLKPVSEEVWRFSDVADHWDDLVLRAWATIDGERTLYQEGELNGLLDPRDLFKKYNIAQGTLASGTAMFGGTLAVIGGIRPADHFEAELYDPKLDRSLAIAYSIVSLPIVA